MCDAVSRKALGVVKVEIFDILEALELLQPGVADLRVVEVKLSHMTHLRDRGHIPIRDASRGQAELDDIALWVFDDLSAINGEGYEGKKEETQTRHFKTPLKSP